ncbi:uncharacterized protein LOC130635621 isoform X1 [Hydractinia symbiolongicarpus]|uniref:uncharacterized protein LOC130635621 isoform X1 n=1 Tax=Hydractinia symbiolongicarpus TaxID=13093 RepID=UPI002549D4AF|nr:uncharacterized protein LOC130635621 isoform X1 [Hydractinia symbiolongicarpus]XP_057300983.1 uncharacterized protein LOC130635621 isoform X1 [Hydractinia symbiolongicarpus]
MNSTHFALYIKKLNYADTGVFYLSVIFMKINPIVNVTQAKKPIYVIVKEPLHLEKKSKKEEKRKEEKSKNTWLYITIASPVFLVVAALSCFAYRRYKRFRSLVMILGRKEEPNARSNLPENIPLHANDSKKLF